MQVFPPKVSTDVVAPTAVSPSKQASTSTSPTSDLSPMSEDEPHNIHKLGGDLKVPAKDVNAKDDPAKYFYKVQILEEQNEKSHEKSKTTAKDRAKWSGSLMEVQCSVMRYDILDFSLFATSLMRAAVVTVLLSRSQFCVGLFAIVWTVILLLLRRGQ